MKFTKSKITIDREISDLDSFALEFITILNKYSRYVIVSGYVAILLGRARASEDIDIITPKIGFSTFQSFMKELKQKSFYCLNTEEVKDMYEYLTEKTPIRFAKKDTIIPNIEMRWAKNKFDTIALEKTIKINLNKRSLEISQLELQIAFKEVVLKSPKDLEDARHMRNVAEKYLDTTVIQRYKEMLRDFYQKKSR
ncbi:MAG: hypothetical protein V1726_07350 [Methanobacteriota archaeon]